MTSQVSGKWIRYAGWMLAGLAALVLGAGAAQGANSGVLIANDGTAVDSGPSPTHGNVLTIGAGSDGSNLLLWIKMNTPYTTTPSPPAATVQMQWSLYWGTPPDCFFGNLFVNADGTVTNSPVYWLAGCGSQGLNNGPYTTQLLCNEIQLTIPYNSLFGSTTAPGPGTLITLGHPSGTGNALTDPFVPLLTGNNGFADFYDYVVQKGTYTLGQSYNTLQGKPTSLSASATGDNQVTPTWTAPVDNGAQPILKYKVYRDGTYIGDSTTTSYNDGPSLTSGTAYSYESSAVNCLGESAKSTAGSVTADFKPSAPTLSAGTVTSSSAALSWTAATDTPASGASGIGGYELYRSTDATVTTADTKLTIPAGSGTLSFTDSGLSATTTYYYAVRALDSKSPTANIGAFSNVVSITTATPPDTTKPSVPTGLTFTDITTTTFKVKWNAATDASGIASYDIFCEAGGAVSTASPKMGTTTGATEFTVTGRLPSTLYTCSVRAIDVPGNVGDLAPGSGVTTATPPDTTPPGTPTPSISAVGYDTATVSWSPVLDNVGVTTYQLRRAATNPVFPSGTLLATISPASCTPSCSFQDTGLAQGTTYLYAVRAADAAGNEAISASVAATTLVSTDTTPPTAPVLTAATAQSSSKIRITWTPATDDDAVAAYIVERGGVPLPAVAVGTACSGGTCTFDDIGLTQETAYTYAVRARDASGNGGALSNSMSATTWPGPDMTGPDAPVLVGAPLSASLAGLSWTVPTDPGGAGVAKFHLFRATSSPVAMGTPVLVADIGTTDHVETGLMPGGTYVFVLRAVDANGNLGAPSNEVTVTLPTLSGQLPTAQLDRSTYQVAVATPFEVQATVAGGVAPVSCIWGADSGQPGVTGASCSGATITFASPGTYTLYLWVSDAVGQGATASAIVEVGAAGAASTVQPVVLDEDHDGVPDLGDNCLGLGNVDQGDRDRDGVGDACDGAPGAMAVSLVPIGPAVVGTPAQTLPGGGRIEDRDGDGYKDSADNCPDAPGIDPLDLDRDGVGDKCDLDADGDKVPDAEDNCLRLLNVDQGDRDADGKGDACDTVDDPVADPSAGATDSTAQPPEPPEAKPKASKGTMVLWIVGISLAVLLAAGVVLLVLVRRKA